MQMHAVHDEQGAPLRTGSLRLSLASILEMTYELSLAVAREKFETAVRDIDRLFISGFSSTLVEVESATACARQLIAKLPPAPPRSLQGRLADLCFRMEGRATR
eukprot:4565236-Prymnesium_polylepis.1